MLSLPKSQLRSQGPSSSRPERPWQRGCQKASFSKRFPSILKRNAGVFKFLRFEERFRKAPFFDGAVSTSVKRHADNSGNYADQ